MLCKVHGEHVTCSVICNTLVPPTHRLFRSGCPRIDVACERGVCSEAEIDGYIRIAFINPQIFVRVKGIVEQMFEFVSEDGFPPR